MGGENGEAVSLILVTLFIIGKRALEVESLELGEEVESGDEGHLGEPERKARPADAHRLQQTGVPQLRDHKCRVKQIAFLLAVGFDAANEVRVGRFKLDHKLFQGFLEYIFYPTQNAN